MIVVKKALYKNFTNFKSKLSNYKEIFKNGIKICKCNREKKLIAVKKISFENFTNLKLEHLKYRGKDHDFYRILNSNSIYEFENNDKELIMRKFISNTKSKICEDEVYEYYKSINGLFSTHRYYDGVLHRTDGVAIEYKDRKYHGYYYINGNYINNNFFNKIKYLHFCISFSFVIFILPYYEYLIHEMFTKYFENKNAVITGEYVDLMGIFSYDVFRNLTTFVNYYIAKRKFK